MAVPVNTVKAADDDRGNNSFTTCPVCCQPGPWRVAEDFSGGRFLECLVCGVQFVDTAVMDLEVYYRNIWMEGEKNCEPYQEKRQAVADPRSLYRLLRDIPRYRWALRQLHRLHPKSRVLDVGCGEGSLLCAARQMGHDIFGCELSPNAAELARKLVASDRIHIGTVETAAYQPESFDCVVALEVIEHLPHPRALIEQSVRILKPNGILLMSMPNFYRVFALAKRLLGRPHSSTDYPPHHLTRWSAPTVAKLLASYFERVAISSLPYHAKSRTVRAVAEAIHLASFRKLGQSLCVTASGPKIAISAV